MVVSYAYFNTMVNSITKFNNNSLNEGLSYVIGLNITKNLYEKDFIFSLSLFNLDTKESEKEFLLSICSTFQELDGRFYKEFINKVNNFINK